MNAPEINTMIRDATIRGRNVYAEHALDKIGITCNIRIVRAKTISGEVKLRTTAGEWFRTCSRTTFDDR